MLVIDGLEKLKILKRKCHKVETLSRNALKSSNLMGGRPLYISVRGGGTPPPWIT
jgi:hypothetical protein